MPKPESRPVVPAVSLATSKVILSFSRIGEMRFHACLRTNIGNLADWLFGLTKTIPFAMVYLRNSRLFCTSLELWKLASVRIVASDSPSGFLYKSHRKIEPVDMP